MNAYARAVGAGLAAPDVLAIGRWLLPDVGDGALRSLVFALVPVSIALPFHVQFSALVIAGDVKQTVKVALTWALATSVFTIVFLRGFDASSEVADALFWNARVYREDMFHWIRTGIGQEGSPST